MPSPGRPSRTREQTGSVLRPAARPLPLKSSWPASTRRSKPAGGQLGPGEPVRSGGLCHGFARKPSWWLRRQRTFVIGSYAASRQLAGNGNFVRRLAAHRAHASGSSAVGSTPQHRSNARLVTWQGKNYRGVPPQDGSAWTVGGAVTRGRGCVLRGGWWANDPGDCGSAARIGEGADTRMKGIGFRVARTLITS
jgi:hypothetical protein